MRAHDAYRYVSKSSSSLLMLLIAFAGQLRSCTSPVQGIVVRLLVTGMTKLVLGSPILSLKTKQEMSRKRCRGSSWSSREKRARWFTGAEFLAIYNPLAHSVT